MIYCTVQRLLSDLGLFMKHKTVVHLHSSYTHYSYLSWNTSHRKKRSRRLMVIVIISSFFLNNIHDNSCLLVVTALDLPTLSDVCLVIHRQLLLVQYKHYCRQMYRWNWHVQLISCKHPCYLQRYFGWKLQQLFMCWNIKALRRSEEINNICFITFILQSLIISVH